MYPKRSKAACPPPRWSKHQANNYPKSWKSSENNGPKPFKNQPQIDQKSIENQPKIHPKSIKHRPNIDQKSTRSEKCRALRLGSRLGGVLEASWRSLRGQHSSKLASQIEGKSIKNQCKNRSKNRCLPSSSFDPILIDFWRENGGMLAPKSSQKSMSTSKGRFCKKYWKTNRISMIF